jgi:hypothetical protein
VITELWSEFGTLFAGVGSAVYPTQTWRELGARATYKKQAGGWGRGLPGLVSKQQPPLACRESHQTTILPFHQRNNPRTTLRFRQLYSGRALGA